MKEKIGYLLGLGLLSAIMLFGYHFNMEKESVPDSEKAENFIKLVVAIPFKGIEENDLSMVEEKINEIVRKELQVEITFVRTNSYSSTVNLMLAGEEQLDVMLASGNIFIESYINDELVSLDNLLYKYGKGIIKEVDSEMIAACKINNRLYGLPNNKDFAAGTNAFMLRKDILEKYHINQDEIQTMEDLEQVFELVKTKEPDMTVLASGGGTMLSNLYFSNLMTNYFRVGVHLDYGRDEELVNLFETEEYYNALKRVRNWYLKGYLDEDMLEETEPLFTRVKKGELFAYTTKWKPGLESQDMNGAKTDLVCVRLGENVVSFNTYAVMPYVITKNTVSARKSMELLNLFYTNEEIANLLSYGVEGVHYKKTEDGHFTYINHEKNNPFINNAWKVPNQFISGVWEGNPLTLWDDMREFNEDSIHACDSEFFFDITPAITEYFTLRNIYSKYKLILENGMVNPEEGLKKMNKEMKENGIDDVLAEERKQFKAWQNRQSQH